MEIIQVFLVQMPAAVKALTVHNSDDSYTILINAGMSHEMQCAAYDHEIRHINNGDYDHMYDVSALELIRHSA